MSKVTVNPSDRKRLRNAVLAIERAVEKTSAQRPDAGPRKKLPNETFAVVVEKDGGFAGANGSADCTFTYTAKNLRGDVTYGEDLPVRWARTPLQEFAEATAGLGCFNEDGEFELWAVDETPVCDPPA